MAVRKRVGASSSPSVRTNKDKSFEKAPDSVWRFFFTGSSLLDLGFDVLLDVLVDVLEQ